MPSDFPIGLDENIKNNLNSLDECDTFLLEAVGEKSYKSWIVADTFLHIKDKFGADSLGPIAGRHGFSGTKPYTYSRVAQAFPIETRIPHVSFSHHLVAMTADKYDRKTGEFLTEKRFDWLDKAAEDSSIKTRDLLYQITNEHKKEETGAEILPCIKCKGTMGDIYTYVLFQPRSRKRAEQFQLHQACCDQIKKFMSDETHAYDMVNGEWVL